MTSVCSRFQRRKETEQLKGGHLSCIEVWNRSTRGRQVHSPHINGTFCTSQSSGPVNREDKLDLNKTNRANLWGRLVMCIIPAISRRRPQNHISRKITQNSLICMRSGNLGLKAQWLLRSGTGPEVGWRWKWSNEARKSKINILVYFHDKLNYAKTTKSFPSVKHHWKAVDLTIPKKYFLHPMKFQFFLDVSRQTCVLIVIACRINFHMTPKY